MDTLLIQLWKGKGSRHSMENLRFLHIKDIYPKLFSQIVLLSVKDKLIENMSKFQIATKPGQSTSEHIFIVFSLMALCEKE